jgi:hypothetical protein
LFSKQSWQAAAAAMNMTRAGKPRELHDLYCCMVSIVRAVSTEVSLVEGRFFEGLAVDLSMIELED